MWDDLHSLDPRPNFSCMPRGLFEKWVLDTFTGKTGSVDIQRSEIVDVNYIVSEITKVLAPKIYKQAIGDDICHIFSQVIWLV